MYNLRKTAYVKIWNLKYWVFFFLEATKKFDRHYIKDLFATFEEVDCNLRWHDCSKAMTLRLLLGLQEVYSRGMFLGDVSTKLNKLSNSISIISLQSSPVIPGSMPFDKWKWVQRTKNVRYNTSVSEIRTIPS